MVVDKCRHHDEYFGLVPVSLTCWGWSSSQLVQFPGLDVCEIPEILSLHISNSTPHPYSPLLTLVICLPLSSFSNHPISSSVLSIFYPPSSFPPPSSLLPLLSSLLPVTPSLPFLPLLHLLPYSLCPSHFFLSSLFSSSPLLPLPPILP